MDSHTDQSPSSDGSFPVLAISIMGILTTAILLLSYYIFVIKCCLNWRRSDLIGRLSRSRRRYRHRDDPVAVHSTAAVFGGLEESVIRAIPTFRFRIDSCDGEAKGSSFHECAVCLNEFQAEERIRLLPGCFHVFHIDCIDTWLQTNANCPLCRSEITTISTVQNDQFIDQTFPHNLRRDEDVVIEVIDDHDDRAPRSEGTSRDSSTGKKGVCSRGDECIDVRGKDERFSVQPMRRSFSMDSSCDRQLQLAVQEIIERNARFKEEGGSSSGSARGRRRFFSFGHCRSLRSSVLPIQVEL